MKLNICFPLHFSGHRISYTCHHISLNMNGPELDVEVTSPSYRSDLQNPCVRPIFPEFFGRALGYIDRARMTRFTMGRFANRLEMGDPVYIWSTWPKNYLEQVKNRDGVIFVEKFNNLVSVAKDILDVAYDHAKIPPGHNIDATAIANDNNLIQFADYIFVANPISADNFVRRGHPAEKIIHSSYGWDPARFELPKGFRRTDPRVTFLFVGIAEIRKGVNLLLEAWDRANIDARLVIAGPISEDIKHICSDILNREDVITLGWTDELLKIYHSADVFVFPTHEEGGPLVTYEAMGCGLPVIVSPMGAGAIARSEIDGFVINPYAIDQWVSAMRQLAQDRGLRESLAQNARRRAGEFTWKTVGINRRRDVLTRVKTH